MNWLDSSNWANIAKTAKTAVKYAQKNIDKVLEIPEIIAEKDSATAQASTKKNETNGNGTPEINPDIKEETEGFFSSFGVSDPAAASSTTNLSKNSSQTSLSTSRLKASPAISRVSSSTSLSGLRAVEAWNSVEIHSTNHSELTSAAALLRTLEHPHVNSIGSLKASGSFSSLHSTSHERARAYSGSSDRLDVLDNAPEFLPAQMSEGRLEILFQDDDTVSNPETSDGLVEVSLLSSVDDATPTVTEVKDENTADRKLDLFSQSIDQSISTQTEKASDSGKSVLGEVVPPESEPNWSHTLADVRIVRSSYSEDETDCPVTAQAESATVVDAIPSVAQSESETVDRLDDSTAQLSSAVSIVRPSPDVEKIQKELDHMRTVLASREQKLVDISRENAQLKETNDNLSSQISDLSASQTDMEQIQKEFTSMERKLQQTVDEKVVLSEQLQQAKNEISMNARAKSDTTGIQLKDALKKLEDKDQQIKELMEEGEKLSKQQFQSSSHIKKQKAKQKELEVENAKMKSDLEDKTMEVTTLKSTLNLAEELDQKNTVTIKQLNASVERLEKDLLGARNLHDEAKSKISSMQGALDSAYKEVAELHRQKAARDGHVHETLLTTELAAKEELRLALEQQKQDLIQGQEELTEKVEVLQSSLSRAEATVKRREEAHREEVADYQQRLQDSMTRNEELSQNLAQATRPLLRQNEALQRQIAEQSASFDKLERSLTKRLQEASTQLVLAQGKERDATDKLAMLTGKIDALESQISSVREERSSLASDFDLERRKARELEEKVTVFRGELDRLRETSTVEINGLRREKQLLEHQTALERENLSMEQRKTAALTEQVTDLQRQTRSTISQSDSAVSLKRSDSVNSTSSTLDGRWSPNSQQTNSLYDVLRGGSAPFLDSVQSQLRLKEGEIQHLKTELRHLEASRQRNTEEMIKLNEKTQEIEKMKLEMEAVQAAKEDLARRYHAMLQMYGEKVEELEELRLDYEDMKALYKSQIDALTQKA